MIETEVDTFKLIILLYSLEITHTSFYPNHNTILFSLLNFQDKPVDPDIPSLIDSLSLGVITK